MARQGVADAQELGRRAAQRELVPLGRHEKPVHVHGGIGIDVTYPVHRFFVAAKRYEFALGGATAQLLRIGDALAGQVL